MKRLVTLAVVPLFAGLLCAQQTETTTTTTKTTFNGTLVDAGCRTTQTEKRESSTSNPDQNTTTTRTTRTTSQTTECPVTMQSTSFGIMTPEGEYISFDEPSNTKVVEIIKSKKWDQPITAHEPLKVRVIGTRKGKVIVVDSIND